MRLFLHLSYNGTNYHGWQRQLNASSVQQEIEEALSIILQKETTILGCGRTDTGVHARSFFAHFNLEDPSFDLSLIKHKLNTILSPSIAILDVLEVIENAHARFNATSRTYEYHIVSNKNPFAADLSYKFAPKLNLDKMNSAANYLLNHEHFQSFCKAKADNYTDLCKVTRADWKQNDERLVFTITADRFLRNMVRAIVGTLLEIGQGNMDPEEIKLILEKKDRQAAGRSVPAQGLFLTEVTYPKELFR